MPSPVPVPQPGAAAKIQVPELSALENVPTFTPPSVTASRIIPFIVFSSLSIEMINFSPAEYTPACHESYPARVPTSTSSMYKYGAEEVELPMIESTSHVSKDT